MQSVIMFISEKLHGICSYLIVGYGYLSRLVGFWRGCLLALIGNVSIYEQLVGDESHSLKFKFTSPPPLPPF